MSLQDLRTICDVVNDVASFTQPEVTWFPDGSAVVWLWIDPEVIGVLTNVSECWYLQEVNIDKSTGQPASLQYSAEPSKIADHRYSPQQVGMRVAQYLVARLRAAAENPQMPAEYHSFATRALQVIMASSAARFL